MRVPLVLLGVVSVGGLIVYSDASVAQPCGQSYSQTLIRLPGL